MLSSQDYRNYRQNRSKRFPHFIHIHILMSPLASYTENDCSLFRSKIRELHPVQRASLGALLQHLSRVASHSEKNGMTVRALAIHFSHAIFRGDASEAAVKACCDYFL